MPVGSCRPTLVPAVLLRVCCCSLYGKHTGGDRQWGEAVEQYLGELEAAHKRADTDRLHVTLQVGVGRLEHTHAHAFIQTMTW